jgi:hypothetical protein
MEPQKRARYSKFLDAEELAEIMMEEESDEELEELNEFIQPTENISSLSSSSPFSFLHFHSLLPANIPNAMIGVECHKKFGPN